jgi:hypothetical protein
LGKGRFFDLAVTDSQLLAEPGILGDKIGLCAHQIGGGAENQRMAGRLGEMQEGVFEGRNQTDNQLDEQMQEGMHVG